jgi:L-ornithine N5-oxygenase
MDHPTSSNDSHFDLVGIGFGPSGIALAAAIEDQVEAGADNGISRVRFLERQADSTWQRGLLLRETDIQHHFLRDLATPRNPRSRFTFANYLKEKDRIYDFGELVFGASGGAVGRLEWSDYLLWAAGLLEPYVSYQQEIVGLAPVFDDAGSALIEVTTSSDSYLAEQLVCCTGRKQKVPELFSDRLGSTIFHATDFVPSIAPIARDGEWRFAVVGSGQSAAEVLTYLHGAFPNSHMASVHRSLGFRYVDLCQFSNEIFHPQEIDYFYALPAERRHRLLEDARYTNYGAVDAQIADTLYRKIYEDQVLGQRRIELLRHSQILDLRSTGDVHQLRVEDANTGRGSTLEADFIILCTGQTEELFPAMLEPLREQIETDEEGAPRLTRDYRVVTHPELQAPIYLSGMCERTHGASDSTSFSMMALRAQRILESMETNARTAVEAAP